MYLAQERAYRDLYTCVVGDIRKGTYALDHVFEASAPLTDNEKIGIIDDRLEPGDWDDELSRGLCNNRAFVAMYTPRYFGRPNCGKELSTFLLRIPGAEGFVARPTRGIAQCIR